MSSSCKPGHAIVTAFIRHCDNRKRYTELLALIYALALARQVMPLTLFSILLLSLFGVGVSLIMVANIFFYTILGEVNGTLPLNKQINMIGVNIKYGIIFRLHTQLFPESKKRKQLKLLWLVGFLVVGAAFVFWVLHFGKW